MKKTLLILVILSANYAVSQAQSGHLERKSTSTQTAVLSPTEKKAYNDSIRKQIQQVESHLNSIQIKWNYIENDPAEKQLATDNGWFDKMTVVKNRLTAKKQLLTDSLI